MIRVAAWGKGGVGKTLLSIYMAHIASERIKKEGQGSLLLVDVDDNQQLYPALLREMKTPFAKPDDARQFYQEITSRVEPGLLPDEVVKTMPMSNSTQPLVVSPEDELFKKLCSELQFPNGTRAFFARSGELPIENFGAHCQHWLTGPLEFLTPRLAAQNPNNSYMITDVAPGKGTLVGSSLSLNQDLLLCLIEPALGGFNIYRQMLEYLVLYQKLWDEFHEINGEPAVPLKGLRLPMRVVLTKVQSAHDLKWASAQSVKERDKLIADWEKEGRTRDVELLKSIDYQDLLLKNLYGKPLYIGHEPQLHKYGQGLSSLLRLKLNSFEDVTNAALDVAKGLSRLRNFEFDQFVAAKLHAAYSGIEFDAKDPQWRELSRAEWSAKTNAALSTVTTPSQSFPPERSIARWFSLPVGTCK